ncbi:cysteine desulfurase NifS [Candidatus Aminicenantes bacterium AC-708-M15]|jgi:cysteine desulfurase|nr:cysteine desulfurase NifS [SCandidatus Aminicenantes bacterium Aminicenantia_JdfR_composite]MCP2597436.1 cysteine desulfurase NifS [Candidatus Aminicenantes bacterium AC-335-G13]MCP2598620.1 cysteine desulfurase NifS [Candidatus Aminicenantes bacterium AC-335-L06]MCP2604378.1 cysteine desulfurase NifS [Candidatus Aminicenantes bacterium AC-708-M15]MCP2618745.1 cysteine desulfurase NifS [Candidatus Aminicenantes bacterium AC-335-A11]MCP2621200.1 cysteine desulfurase NifS [Candidatus Aminicen
MIYLDNNATTPLEPSVAEKMINFIREHFGNPSSLYPIGRKVKEMIEEAREEIAKVIGASKNEIIFTGSGTEADNFALRGILDAYPNKNEIITSSIEHPAIMSTCQYLEKKGYKVTYLPVDEYGVVDLNVLEDSITDKTALISVMHANNEIGTIQPIEEISKIAKRKGVLLHTDAVQTLGKIDVNVDKLGVDLLSISAHKIYGPKGVGALYIRKGVKICPLIHGGHQERLLRAGTENTIGIIGFGEAARIIREKGKKDLKRIEKLADMLKEGIEKNIPKVKFNGHPEKRVKSTLNFSFIGLEGEAILLALATKGIYVSTGSACSEGSEETSHVLSAIGLRPEIARSSIRFSLGRFNTEEDIKTVLKELPEIIAKLREISSFDDEL